LPAAFHALAAEQALVYVVGKYKAFFFFVQNRHVNGTGWTIHYTQTTACASLLIPFQKAAQAGRINLPDGWVILGRRSTE
jgi:hypothetical protein